MAGSNKAKRCECQDDGCNAHPMGVCTSTTRTRRYYRVDMQDVSGTAFCGPRAEDAMESGLFTDAS